MLACTISPGVKYPSPLIIAPVGVQGIVHADAEIATAKAAAKCGVPFCLSTAATRSMETLIKEVPEGPKWYQLYWPSKPPLLRLSSVQSLTMRLLLLVVL